MTLSKKDKTIITAIAIFIVVAVSVFITVAPKIGLPGWNDIFNEIGISGVDKDSLDDFSVHYIDVGQGDCELIVSNGEAMMIDCGERENAEKVLDYLKSYDIKSLKYVIATHPHTDHIGAMEKVIRNVEVENIIMPRLTKENSPTTKTYENLLIAIKDSGAKAIAAKPGDVFDLGNSKVNILAPISQSDDLNNMSVVCKVVYYDTSFLFVGDAEEIEEKDILKSGADLSADVLKVGHHGSNSSSSKDFLKAVNPSLAIISCGKDNKYGHPTKKTLSKLKSMDINYLRTDIKGTIIVKSDGEKISFICEKGE